jgi:hypothetical protein
MHNPFQRFTIKVTLLLVVAFFIHLSILKILQLPLFDNKIVLSYIVNLVLVIVIFGALYLLKDKYKDQLGFFFIAGSALKFGVFFVVFYPFFKEDGLITKLEFASFFVPYGLGLILETFSLTKWLNKLD